MVKDENSEASTSSTGIPIVIAARRLQCKLESAVVMVAISESELIGCINRWIAVTARQPRLDVRCRDLTSGWDFWCVTRMYLQEKDVVNSRVELFGSRALHFRTVLVSHLNFFFRPKPSTLKGLASFSNLPEYIPGRYRLTETCVCSASRQSHKQKVTG